MLARANLIHCRRTEGTTNECKDSDLGEVGEEEHGDDDTDGGECGLEQRREHRLEEGRVCLGSAIMLRFRCSRLTAKQVKDTLMRGISGMSQGGISHHLLE